MIETINVVNKEVSRSLGISEETVKLVNKFFWRYGVKESIQSGQHTSIRVKNIGTLVTSRNKINNRLRKIIRSIRQLKEPDREFKIKTREQYLEQQYNELRIMLARRNDIAIAYKNNKDRSKQRYDKAYKTDMGEQTPDHAGGGIEDLLFTRDQSSGQGEIR